MIHKLTGHSMDETGAIVVVEPMSALNSKLGTDSLPTPPLSRAGRTRARASTVTWKRRRLRSTYERVKTDAMSFKYRSSEY